MSELKRGGSSSMLNLNQQAGQRMAEKLAEATAVGSRIRSAREAKGLSTEELAERMNKTLQDTMGSITAGTISQIESGSIETPSEPVLGAFAISLGLDKEGLISAAGGEEATPDEARVNQ